jgi:plastocyanin
MNNQRRQARLSDASASPAHLPSQSFLRLFGAVLLLASSLIAQEPQHIVTIKQMHFYPSQLSVAAGDTIEWKNEDIFSHSVTADDGSFDSGLISPGSSWKETISKPGTISYHCRPHPNMKAEVVVQAPGEHGQHAQARMEGGSLRWSPPTRPDEIHPILVNFTAALFPLALLSDILGRTFRTQAFHAAGFWMMIYGAAITPLTVAAGWWWKSKEAQQLPASLIMVHQWLGTAAALLFIVLAVWRWRLYRRTVPPSWTYLAVALVAVLALVYQGSLGGAMVFGH